MIWLLIPRSVPRVLSSKPITHDGAFKGHLVTDGSRIYFPEFVDGNMNLAQVSTAGGDTLTIPVPFRNVNIFSLSPDHSTLLAAQFNGLKGSPFWALPLPVGSPRRLSNILGRDAAWSPDGKQLAFSQGLDFYVADFDGSRARKIRTFTEIPTNIRYSPDGRRVRLTLNPIGKNINSIWELNADGSNLHRLLPGWKTSAPQCCGDWTRDGRYYIFEVQVPAGTIDLWALREKQPPFQKQEPTQLTTGPLWYTDPIAAPDSDRIFANGQLLQGELVSYDAPSGQFRPYLSGVSAGEADFSPDGQWIVYVSYPELTLWRSRVDGSQRMQLTYRPIYATLPRWSPDAKQIAFVGLQGNSPWRIYLVSADGGSPQELLPKTARSPT